MIGPLKAWMKEGLRRAKIHAKNTAHNRKEGNRPKNYAEIAFLIAVLRKFNENIFKISLKCSIFGNLKIAEFQQRKRDFAATSVAEK